MLPLLDEQSSAGLLTLDDSQLQLEYVIGSLKVRMLRSPLDDGLMPLENTIAPALDSFVPAYWNSSSRFGYRFRV